MENVSNPYELLFLDSDEPNMKSIILTMGRAKKGDHS